MGQRKRGWEPSAHQIEAAMAALMQAKSQLTSDESQDAKLILDTIEGESDALEIIEALASQYKADTQMAKMARDRAKRLDARAEKAKRIAEEMVLTGGIPGPIERSTVTASIEHSRHTIITDESVVPGDLRRPDKTEIGRRLKKGEDVPGAVLSNPEPHLVFRFI